MEKLEQYIRDNREFFDDEEPAPGHVSRFEERLAKEMNVVPITRSRHWMRVAVTVVVLITAGSVGYDMLSKKAFRSSDEYAAVTFSSDTREALDYYSKLTDDRMTEINKIASTCPQGNQLKSQAEKESATFDANSRELTDALKENPGNQRVEAALIRNQQMKESALSNIILQGNLDNCK